MFFKKKKTSPNELKETHLAKFNYAEWKLIA